MIIIIITSLFTSLACLSELKGILAEYVEIYDLGRLDCRVSRDIISQPRSSFHWIIWLFKLISHSPAVMTYSQYAAVL